LVSFNKKKEELTRKKPMSQSLRESGLWFPRLFLYL